MPIHHAVVRVVYVREYYQERYYAKFRLMSRLKFHHDCPRFFFHRAKYARF